MHCYGSLPKHYCLYVRFFKWYSVVPVGKITSDVSLFEEYGEDIAIEIADDGGNVQDISR